MYKTNHPGSYEWNNKILKKLWTLSVSHVINISLYLYKIKQSQV
jgi:hypothetical protein